MGQDRGPGRRGPSPRPPAPQPRSRRDNRRTRPRGGADPRDLPQSHPGARRGALLGILAAALLICAVGLPRVVWRDDPFALGAPLDPELAAEDARVRARVSRMDTGRFVVLLAPDLETARITSHVYNGNVAARPGYTVVRVHRCKPGAAVQGLPQGAPRAIAGFDHHIHTAGQINPQRLAISPSAHLITPVHRALDAAQEALRADGQIGTTRRGIGPAYMDKTSRQGLRVEQMLDEEAFADAVRAHVVFANRLLTQVYQAEPLDEQVVAAEYLEYARLLKPYIGDTSGIIYRALQQGENVLAEGAQGTLLDLDHGTYPFVTSSNPTAAGALIGLGVGPRWVHQVIGVAKAFQTRVGEGGFPTELSGDLAGRLRGTGENPWDEFGTTTGRPRRVGWLDLVLLRYAVRVNGFTHLAITKLDILTGLPELKVCIGYQREGMTYANLPMGTYQMESYEPIYLELPGWEQDIQAARTWQDLPHQAQEYIQVIENQVGVEVGWISVGPERDQMVSRVDAG